MHSKSSIGPMLVLLVLALVTAFVAYDRFSEVDKRRASIAESASPRAEPAVNAVPLEIRVPAAAAGAAPRVTARAAPAPDEPTLMSQLRGVVETEPEMALRLAREGNVRFPNGKDGAERGWAICKALTNLRRFDEAREEAQVMVKQYPGTTFAGDITKHILINPGTHPSERGYGKKLELE